MKRKFLKATLFAVLCVFSSMAQAQIEKGMKRLGGNLGVYNQSTDFKDSARDYKYSTTSLSLSPSLGYFVSSKVCIGLNVSFAYTHTGGKYNYYDPISKGESRRNSFEYGVNPYLRYYMPFTEKFYGYINVGAGFSIENYSSKASTNSSDFITTRWDPNYKYTSGVNFGLTYFVTPKLALEASIVGLTYSGNFSKNSVVSYENHERNSYLSLTYAPSNLNLGVSYYFK